MKKIKCNFKFMLFILVLAMVVTQISATILHHFAITNYFIQIVFDAVLAAVLIFVFNKFGFLNWLIAKKFLDAEDI